MTSTKNSNEQDNVVAAVTDEGHELASLFEIEMGGEKNIQGVFLSSGRIDELLRTFVGH